MKKKIIKNAIVDAINKLAPKKPAATPAKKKGPAARPAAKPSAKAAPKKPVDPQVAASPNHAKNAVPKAPRKQTNVERVKKRLIARHGYEEDELKSLFKTDAELLAFYNDVVNAPTDSDTEDEIGWDLTDAMDAPIADKERFTKQRREQQVRAYEQLKAQQAAAAAAAAVRPSPNPGMGGEDAGVNDPAQADPSGSPTLPNPNAPRVDDPRSGDKPAKPAQAPAGKTGSAPVTQAELQELGLTLEEFLAAGDDIDAMFRD